MSIKFICSCGKHLRARDEMAARRSMCPACGAPVGVPSRASSQRGAPAGPLSRAEIEARRHAAPEFPPEDAPDGTAAVADGPDAPPQSSAFYFPDGGPQAPPGFDPIIVVHRKKAADKQTAAPWPEVFYPLRAAALASLGLAFLSTFAAHAWSQESTLPREPGYTLLLGALPVLLAGVLVGYLSRLFEWVLLCALGDVRRVQWPGGAAPVWALRGGVTWAACFLAGPALPALAALRYWVQAGEFTPLDYLIVAELSAVALGYWVLAVGSMTRSGRVGDANPVRVAQLALFGPHRAPLLVFVASGLALVLGWLALTALEEQHSKTGLGWVLLGGFWVGVTVSGCVVFALLGRWCRPRVDARTPFRLETSRGE